MVRGDLGFTGVVISDDLAAAAMRDLSPGQRMLRFLRAGGDLAIVGDPSLAARMADAVVDEARDDPKLAAADRGVDRAGAAAEGPPRAGQLLTR